MEPMEPAPEPAGPVKQTRWAVGFYFFRINIALVTLDKYVRFVSCCSVLKLFVHPKRTKVKEGKGSGFI